MGSLSFGAHHKLSNLCAIIDYNKIQSFGNTNDVLRLEPLIDKLKAFNWNVISIDGHDHDELLRAFDVFKHQKDIPTVIIANTIKEKVYLLWRIIWYGITSHQMKNSINKR